MESGQEITDLESCHMCATGHKPVAVNMDYSEIEARMLAAKENNARLIMKIENTMEKLRNQLKLPETYRRVKPKVGRNAPCPCGSAMKYKKCCGR